MTKEIFKDTGLVLAFSRKLEVSDALMISGLWENIDKEDLDLWQPIKLIEKRNRATKSQYGAKDEEKKDSNLSWGDDASLPDNADTLKVKFTLKILGNVNAPSACNNPELEKKIKSKKYDFEELARRYAHNIASGRFLWRNRVGAEEITIRVKQEGKKPLEFNGYNYKLDSFDDKTGELESLTQIIKSGLKGERFEYFEIAAFAKLGFSQHVWPSQEMVLNIPKGEKSRILFKLNYKDDHCAAIHSEKIGNALRTIDTWYKQDEAIEPIAIEPYGSVTQKGEAHRSSTNDFYTLFEKWINKDNEDNSISENDKNYITAILVRGGVFSGSSKEKSKK